MPNFLFLSISLSFIISWLQTMTIPFHASSKQSLLYQRSHVLTVACLHRHYLCRYPLPLVSQIGTEQYPIHRHLCMLTIAPLAIIAFIASHGIATWHQTFFYLLALTCTHSGILSWYCIHHGTSSSVSHHSATAPVFLVTSHKAFSTQQWAFLLFSPVMSLIFLFILFVCTCYQQVKCQNVRMLVPWPVCHHQGMLHPSLATIVITC